jgi:scyllo-inositol 2-dehydrogenase (NADP+)
VSLRVIVAGMGIQGAKRHRAAGENVVATVDPVAKACNFKDVRDVPLGDFDAAILCIPDGPKVALIEYLLSNKKHVLI